MLIGALPRAQLGLGASEIRKLKTIRAASKKGQQPLLTIEKLSEQSCSRVPVIVMRLRQGSQYFDWKGRNQGRRANIAQGVPREGSSS